MSREAQARFSIRGWDEKTWDGRSAREVQGAKLTHAEVTYRYEGDVEGTSTVHYLMHYREDGTGQFTALERFDGTVHGRAGGFVLQHSGTFDGMQVSGILAILAGSGTGELAGISGEARVDIAGHQESYPFVLVYEE